MAKATSGSYDSVVQPLEGVLGVLTPQKFKLGVSDPPKRVKGEHQTY